MKVSCLIGLLYVLLSFGCEKSKNFSRNGGSGGPPPVSTSSDVVHLGGSGAGMSEPGSGDVQVPIRIDPGYHVNANPATFPYLIATEVTAEKVEGLELGKPVYPPAIKKKFQFANEPLSVYEGNVNVTLPFVARSSGTRSLPISVRVQACDQEKCFSPATLKTNISINVDAK